MAASIETIKASIPDFAKDIKINLGNLLTKDGSPGLSEKQIAGIALSSAYATRHKTTIKQLADYCSAFLSPEEIQAAQAAASIMAMNNVYYRALSLISDKEYKAMPAKLRMMVLGNPGIEKKDFELYSLAVSSINGCGSCLDSHANLVIQNGIPKEGVQSTLRIAAVINALAQALTITEPA